MLGLAVGGTPETGLSSLEPLTDPEKGGRCGCQCRHEAHESVSPAGSVKAPTSCTSKFLVRIESQHSVRALAFGDEEAEVPDVFPARL
jgi:hypothetical protein